MVLSTEEIPTLIGLIIIILIALILLLFLVLDFIKKQQFKRENTTSESILGFLREQDRRMD